MDNNEINPELKKMLESLQDVPERGLQASHAGRENFMAQVKSLDPRRSVSRKAARQGKPLGRRTWVTRFATITAVIVVALSSLGGTIYAAQAAQPDDLLYGVKTLTEEIQVRLEGDPEEKLDLYVSFANRRLEEIQNQIAAGEQVSEKALALLEQHTQRMLEQAAKLDEMGMNKALHQIEENLQEQNQTMAELGQEQLQGNDPRLEKALETIRERLELVKHGIREPKGFRERMHSDQFNPQNDGKEIGNPPDPQSDPDGGQNSTITPGSGTGNNPGGK
jgi:hypothetical protein